MRYRIAPLYVRPWTLNGISARLIESHYEHNYGSAVVRLNAVSKELEHLESLIKSFVCQSGQVFMPQVLFGRTRC